MANRIPKEYLELDEIADGIFTSEINPYPTLNMTKLIKYCRSNNIDPENLTNEEIQRFCEPDNK